MKYIEIEKDTTYINPAFILKAKFSQRNKTKPMEQPQGTIQVPDGTEWVAKLIMTDGSEYSVEGRQADLVRAFIR